MKQKKTFPCAEQTRSVSPLRAHPAVSSSHTPYPAVLPPRLCRGPSSHPHTLYGRRGRCTGQGWWTPALRVLLGLRGLRVGKGLGLEPGSCGGLGHTGEQLWVWSRCILFSASVVRILRNQDQGRGGGVCVQLGLCGPLCAFVHLLLGPNHLWSPRNSLRQCSGPRSHPLLPQMKGVNLSCVRTCMVVAEERPRIALTQSFSKLFKDLGLPARAVSTTFGCRVNVAICLQVKRLGRSSEASCCPEVGGF